MTESLRSLLPDDLRATASRQFDRLHLRWLAAPEDEAWPLSVPLKPAAARVALEQLATFRLWLQAWRDFECEGTGVRLEWQRISTRHLGEVDVPSRAVFANAQVVAECAGQAPYWSLLQTRSAELRRCFPALGETARWSRSAAAVAQWPAEDVARLHTMLAWADANRDSGLYLRQLPMRGIDTKWMAPRAPVLVPLLQTLLGRSGDLHEILGLRRSEARVRMRLLDTRLRARMGGVSDVEMPVTQWARVFASDPPRRLLVIENLETGLALPDIDDTIAVMGLGNAVNLLADIPWCANARSVYWGDLDTHGLHILARARAVLPAVQSALMSEQVLLSHRELWTNEPRPAEGTAEGLQHDERQLLLDLQRGRWGVGVRLEQERIPWPDAVAALSAALGASA